MDDSDKGNVVQLKVVPKPTPPPLPQPHGQHCGSCNFYMIETIGAAGGICRRFPPPVMITLQNPQNPADLQHIWHFPRMIEAGWCGEWKLRDHEAETKTDS